MVQWDYDGKPIRMIGLHEDVTELKQLQEKYELVMMATGTGVWDWPDITKDKAIWDDNYFRLLGYEPGELTPSVSTYQSLAYPGEYTGVDLSKVTDGMSYQTEIRLRHKNGFYYWFLINGIFSYNSNSKTYRLTGSIMRIHERKMAEQRFRLAVEASPNAMIMINKEQNIVMVNHQAVTLFQYSEEELQKMSIHQLLPERFRPNHGKLVSQFMQEPQRVTLSKGRELYGIKKDGTEVRVELGLTPIEIDQEIFVISSIVDLTESVKAREELEKHQLKALEAARMAHIGEMAAGIAHEINNPLTIIKGRIHSMKSLLQSDCDQSTIANNLVKIESTVDRIAAIIRGLRTFSRDGGHDEMRLITVEHLINETFDYCKSRLKNDGVELKVDIENPSLQFPCRSVQLSQVLLNMIQNSRDAIISQNDPWIAIKAWSNKKSLCISITDSGSGVPDQIREKLFDPFFTTKEVGKGTGLGLSLSKSIIESHNGSLSLDTKSPNTKFIISLPLN